MIAATRQIVWRVIATILLIAASASGPFLLPFPEQRVPSRKSVSGQPVDEPAALSALRAIVSNNLRLCALLVAGLVTGGLVTVSVLISVPFATSALLLAMHRSIGGESSHALVYLLPHGVLEVAGFVIAGAAGLGGMPILLCLANGDTQHASRNMKSSLLLGFIGSVLIVVAGVVEAFVTPMIARVLL